MKYTNERDLVGLLIEAQVIDERSSRTARRAQIQKARALLGTRDLDRAAAIAAIRDRNPFAIAARSRRDTQVIAAAASLGTPGRKARAR